MKLVNFNVDIVFFIDLFIVVGIDGFNKEKSFVKLMVKYMNVFLGKFRVFVIFYYFSICIILNFIDF